MITRRQFCTAAGTGLLSLGLNPSAIASPSIKVLGIGGAGCNIVDELRRRCAPESHITTYTVNRAEVGPRDIA